MGNWHHLPPRLTASSNCPAMANTSLSLEFLPRNMTLNGSVKISAASSDGLYVPAGTETAHKSSTLPESTSH